MTLAHLPPPEDPPFDADYDQPTKTTPIDYERAILGTLILRPELRPTVAPEVDPSDFQSPAHETIWNSLHRIPVTGDTATDSVALITDLTRTGDLQRIGGAEYLATLAQTIPPVGDPLWYASKVRNAARRRTIGTLGTKFRQLETTGDDDQIDHVLDQALQALDETVARFGPRTHTGPTAGLHDLTWILDGEPPTQPPPIWCRRTDGHALFYAGKVNGIFGDPECGKTWVAQVAIVEALSDGQTAAMIDVDHNGADHTVARLLLLGARPDHLADPTRFRYFEPEDADQLKHAVTQITAWAPAILVVDSLGEILPMLGVKSVDNDEITTALRLICTPPANAGTCVITIDHLPKSAEARVTGYAIGGTAKKRIMRGSYIRAEMRTQPAPGQVGKVTLRIEKDTVGELRKHTPGGYAGTFTIDSRQPHVTITEISRDDSPITADGTFRPTHLMEAISRFVEDNDQARFTEIKDAVKGKDAFLRTAVQTLVTEGFMSILPGPKRAQLHHSISHYREAEDDHLNRSDDTLL